jgi:ABC-type phosphate transport system auxiliary subunit
MAGEMVIPVVDFELLHEEIRSLQDRVTELEKINKDTERIYHMRVRELRSVVDRLRAENARLRLFR